MTYWHYGQAIHRTVFFGHLEPREKGTCAGTGAPREGNSPCGDKDSSVAWSEAQDEACTVLGSLHKTALPFTASTLQCVKMPEGGEVSRCSQNGRA